MDSLSLNPLANLADSVVEGDVVAFGAGFDRACYMVTTQEGSTPGYKVYRECDGYFLLTLTVEIESFNITFVQPLVDGNFLLAGARSRYNLGQPEKNARIYSPDGQLVDSFTLGDGIEDIQVARDGMIWVSYFDEGVFGNFGWSQPLGQSGLVRWAPNGSKDYEFQPPAGLGDICDCYAMNTSGSDIWAYYYTDFPLVQIKNGAVINHGEPPVSGSDGFAVGAKAFLFRGGYGSKDEYLLLNRKDLKVERKFELIDSEGDRVKARMVATREETIFILSGDDVYRLSIPEVASLK